MHTTTFPPPLRRSLLALTISASLWGCVSNPPAPSGTLSLEQASVSLANDMIEQANPSLVQRMMTRRIVLDPFLDAQSGQQTVSSQKAAELFSAQLQQRNSNLRLEPFDASGVEKADYLIAGTLRKISPQDTVYIINATLTERRTGMVIASAMARVNESELDHTPTSFYSDSPSVVTDRLTQGYISTAQAEQGGAADPAYLASLSTAALISEAHDAYENKRWDDALIRYQSVVERPDGKQLKAFNGLYNTHVKLGNEAQAQAAFGQIVALGLATDNLAVRLLFTPGTTEFWKDSSSSGAYPMWLRQIAKGTHDGEYCLKIVGHTSRTGSEAVNERLSLARASAVRDLLVKNERPLQQRIEVAGMGWKQNIIGSGTDDLRDAIDRRVEFKTQLCK